MGSVENIAVVPPGLQLGDARRRCGLCVHGGRGECLRYGARVRPTEVCQSFEPKESTMLTPGAQARVYRDGTLLASVLVPEGRMELRHLQPGQYELRDETGGRVLIEVPYNVETVVVQEPKGADKGPVAAADASQPVVQPVLEVDDPPVHPGPQKHSRIRKADGEWRVAPPEVDDAA